VPEIVESSVLSGRLASSGAITTPGTRLRRRWAVAGGAAIVLSIAAAVGVWFYLARPPADDCAIPDRPSIAVLPFDNLSGGPDQEYFSDGITEDIITELSGIKKLFVIARHSSFAYKGGTDDVEKIACELGVRYLLEGSVRKADNRVRINAQLIDAATGDHIWAERYDSELGDIFKLQDDVTEKIVTALDIEIEIETTARALAKPTENLDAYDYLLRGRQHLFQVTQSSNGRAREMFRKAVELDPEYARAYANLTWTHLNDWRLGWTDDPEQALGLAYAAAQKAVTLDDFDAGNHSALGDVYLWLKQHGQAIVELERALALNRNDAGSHASMGDILTWAGQPEAAIEPIERAMRLNPHYPITYIWYLGHANFLLQRHDAAIRALRQLSNRKPDFLAAHLYLAATYSELGRDDEAKAALAEAYALNPRLSKRVLTVILPYKEASHLARVLAALNKAGLAQ
jgi:adenylate cyclase